MSETNRWFTIRKDVAPWVRWAFPFVSWGTIVLLWILVPYWQGPHVSWEVLRRRPFDAKPGAILSEARATVKKHLDDEGWSPPVNHPWHGSCNRL